MVTRSIVPCIMSLATFWHLCMISAQAKRRELQSRKSCTIQIGATRITPPCKIVSEVWRVTCLKDKIHPSSIFSFNSCEKAATLWKSGNFPVDSVHKSEQQNFIKKQILYDCSCLQNRHLLNVSFSDISLQSLQKDENALRVKNNRVTVTVT